MIYALIALALTASALAGLLAAKAIRLARFALAQRLGPVKRLEALELAQGDLQERHDALRTSFKRLQSRVGMREARAALNGQGEPDAAQEALPLPSADERDQLKRMLANKIIS